MTRHGVRRRRDEWIRLGVFDQLRLAVLDAHEKMIGLDLADVAVAAAPPRRLRRECTGRRPVDRGQGGIKRSQLTQGASVPLATVSAPANTVDHHLLAATRRP